MKPVWICMLMGGVIIFLSTSCSQKKDQVVLLKSYPVENLEGLITRDGVATDSEIFTEGNTSLKIVADGPRVVKLFELNDPDVENCRLIYQARMKSDGLQGEAFLEMWCRFPGQGEFFSRGLQSKLTGSNDWSAQETPFFLKKGENPDLVKLNLVIDGHGTVWIDDIKLLKSPM